MCNLGIVLLAIYIAVLLLSIAGKFNAWAGEFNLPTLADWVKLIFWPITVVVYFLGLLLWLLIWVPRKLFTEYYCVLTKLKISL